MWIRLFFSGGGGFTPAAGIELLAFAQNCTPKGNLFLVCFVFH